MLDFISNEIATIYDQAGNINTWRAGTTNIEFYMPYGGNTYARFLVDGDLYYFPNGSGGIPTPTFLQSYTAGTSLGPGIQPGFPSSSGYASYYLALK